MVLSRTSCKRWLWNGWEKIGCIGNFCNNLDIWQSWCDKNTKSMVWCEGKEIDVKRGLHYLSLWMIERFKIIYFSRTIWRFWEWLICVMIVHLDWGLQCSKGLSFTCHISLVFFFLCVVPKNARDFFFCSSFLTVFWFVRLLLFFSVLNTLELTFVVTTSPTAVAVRGRRPSGREQTPVCLGHYR